MWHLCRFLSPLLKKGATTIAVCKYLLTSSSVHLQTKTNQIYSRINKHTFICIASLYKCMHECLYIILCVILFIIYESSLFIDEEKKTCLLNCFSCNQYNCTKETIHQDKKKIFRKKSTKYKQKKWKNKERMRLKNIKSLQGLLRFKKRNEISILYSNYKIKHNYKQK